MYYTSPNPRLFLLEPDIYPVDEECGFGIRVFYAVSTDKKMVGGGGDVMCYEGVEDVYGEPR